MSGEPCALDRHTRSPTPPCALSLSLSMHTMIIRRSLSVCHADHSTIAPPTQSRRAALLPTSSLPCTMLMARGHAGLLRVSPMHHADGARPRRTLRTHRLQQRPRRTMVYCGCRRCCCHRRPCAAAAAATASHVLPPAMCCRWLCAAAGYVLPLAMCCRWPRAAASLLPLPSLQ